MTHEPERPGRTEDPSDGGSSVAPSTGSCAHGLAPYSAALLHGGPGSVGDMAPVARALAARLGLLEPWSTAGSLQGQLDELHRWLAPRASFPLALAGHSWGAWLAYLYASHHPELVRKLILIDCPPFEESYEERIPRTRAGRLTADQNADLERIFGALAEAAAPERAALLARLDVLLTTTDAFDPTPEPRPGDRLPRLPSQLFRQAWEDVSELRRSGRLLELGSALRCPVVAFHGDYDPIPADGVEVPLRRVLADFRLRVLPRCGHTPWKERQARDVFLGWLADELEAPPPPVA